MGIKDLTLGIDTSNYTTSVAVVGKDGEIFRDIRKPLAVKAGDRGLRQSYAHFQHVETLPGLIGEAIDGEGRRLGAVGVSVRPRPVESSYMPVFRAGESFATAISSVLGIPVFRFSHQEGHIEAVKRYSGLKNKEEFLCFHLSGGTCELLRITGKKIEIIGGSRDISFGQVIDRVGVRLGIAFPCGARFDEISLNAEASGNRLKDIPLNGLEINLSGIETQAVKIIDGGLCAREREALIKEILNKICNVIIKMTERAVASTNLRDVMFTGGVSSSKYLYAAMRDYFHCGPVSIDFGDQRLASDNAVGAALLGGKSLWQ